MRTVKCEKCSALNRLEKFSFQRTPLCGNCRSLLKEPFIYPLFRTLKRNIYWVVLLLLIAGGVVTYNTGQPPKSTSAQYSPVSKPDAQSVSCSPVPASHGVKRKYTRDEPVAPLRIETPYGEEKYFVKLVDAYSGSTVMTFFIHGGRAFETEVPLGIYKIRYAAGNIWCGENLLFGQDTQYSEADKTFNFSIEGNQISGYTVQLIKQVGGNLRTRRIGANQF